jgi:hypothetical protein
MTARRGDSARPQISVALPTGHLDPAAGSRRQRVECATRPGSLDGSDRGCLVHVASWQG